MSHSCFPLIWRKTCFLLSPLEPLYGRRPYITVGKNHAARETTYIFIIVWFLQKKQKPKMFTTACNVAGLLMVGNMCGKLIMSWYHSSCKTRKPKMYNWIIFGCVLDYRAQCYIFFLSFFFIKESPFLSYTEMLSSFLFMLKACTSETDMLI